MAQYHDVAAAIRDSLPTRMQALGVTVPARRYISAGQPAFDITDSDCDEFFAVELLGLQPVLPTAGIGGVPVAHGCAIPVTTVFRLWLLRCVHGLTSSGHPPSVDELNADGEIVTEDAYALWFGFIAAITAGDFGGACSDWRIIELASVPTEGYLAGWRLDVQLQGA